MTISAIPLNQVSEADLQRLIDNRVPESITLEFKRESYGPNDEAKREWLKNISALANTAGGDLIIEVEEEDGVASKLVGIKSTTADEEIRRLEAILQDGLEPRLIGTQIHPVVLSAGGFVLVVRVLRSWNAPHRVVYQRSNRFYGRNAGSAFELGVEQLRNTFLGVAETERRLTDFRLERLARLKTGIGDPLLIGPGQLVLHLMPLQTPVVSISAHDAKQWNAGFAPMGATNWNRFVNFDGVLLAPGQTSGSRGYTAFTRFSGQEGLRQVAGSCSSAAATMTRFSLTMWVVFLIC
ncbi:MAG: ATP-binding protein [Roseomonas sp.]|nr:ATP-binding protein [Roseomonas sp.]